MSSCSFFSSTPSRVRWFCAGCYNNNNNKHLRCGNCKGLLGRNDQTGCYLQDVHDEVRDKVNMQEWSCTVDDKYALYVGCTRVLHGPKAVQ